MFCSSAVHRYIYGGQEKVTVLQLAQVFQDRMVIQCDKALRIFGRADTQGVLKLLVNGKSLGEAHIEPGEFSCVFTSRAASRSNTLELHFGDEVRQFTDVAFGEVWLAGGQSNMEFPLRYDRNYKKIRQNLSDADIRCFEVPRRRYEDENLGSHKTYLGVNTWRSLTPTSCGDFSAAALYFALEIRRNLGVPVGIISCNYGGTSALAWTREEYLAQDAELAKLIDAHRSRAAGIGPEEYERREKRYAGLQRGWLWRLFNHLLMKGLPFWVTRILGVAKNLAPQPPVGHKSLNRPGGLFSTMVSPIAGYGLRGILWYQGESDADRAGLYSRLFTATISCWRDAWGEDLPFLFVQLAPFLRWMNSRGEKFPALREAQQSCADEIPGVWMASVMDAGMRDDIHPKDKQPVGRRLALLALAYMYNADVPCESPRLRSARFVSESLYATGCPTNGRSAGKSGPLPGGTADGKSEPLPDGTAEGKSGPLPGGTADGKPEPLPGGTADGKPASQSGPVLELTFEHSGDGLQLRQHWVRTGKPFFFLPRSYEPRGSICTALEIRDAQGSLIKVCQAHAQGERLLLQLRPGFAAGPLDIVFAGKPWCRVNLYNSSWLAARPESIRLN